MGIIKMAIGAVRTGFQDQVLEYFRCDNMTTDTLSIPATKVVRGKAVNNGTADYISSGSRFDVAIGQAALLVENGKVHDMVICLDNDTAGQYRYDSAAAPSILDSGFSGILPSIKDIGDRFTLGGQAGKTMRLVYINIKNNPGNPIGFGAVTYMEPQMNLMLDAQAHGKYEFKIADPARFYESYINDISKPVLKGSGDGKNFIEQIRAALQQEFNDAIGELSDRGVPYHRIAGQGREVCKILNDILKDELFEKGVELVDMKLTLNLTEKAKKTYDSFNEARVLTQNPAMMVAREAESINRAREGAATNTAGAMNGFVGMGMAGGGMMGQRMDPSMFGFGGNGGGGPQGGPGGPAPGGFNNPNPQQRSANEPAPAPVDGWTCECGETNTGRFCQGCGKSKPEPKKEPAAGGWKCECGASNTGKFCVECGKAQPAKAEDGWKCECGAVNKGKFCMECGKKKPAAEPLYKCDKCGWEPADPKNPPKFCPECGDIFDEGDIQN